MTARTLVTSVVVFAFLAGHATPSFAQSPTPPTSPTSSNAEIKQRGDEAMEGGRPADALAAYIEAYERSPDAALLYNKGRARQALGDYPGALLELESFEKVASPELKARVPGLARMIAALRARVTTVTIACATAGARVRLGDRTVGTCPLQAPLVVVSGRATLDITADGYFPYVRELDLPPGGRSSLDARLASKTTTGILVVKSNVPNAVVAIDGEGLGMVPVEAILAAGQHRLELQRDGYRTSKTIAQLAPGERREIEVPLEAEGTIFGTWWFWTGAVLVVAGGVAVAVALTTEKEPEPGTVPPGIVTGGLRGAGFHF